MRRRLGGGAARAGGRRAGLGPSDSHADGDQYAHQHSDPNGDQHAHQHANSYRHSNGDQHAYPDGDQHAHRHANSYRHPNGNQYADRHTNPDGDQHTHQHAYPNRDSPDEHADRYSHTDTGPSDEHADRYSDSNRYSHADRRADGDAHRYPDSDAHRGADGDAHRYPDRDAHRGADRHADRGADRNAYRSADRDAHRNANRHPNRDADRHPDRSAHGHPDERSHRDCDRDLHAGGRAGGPGQPGQHRALDAPVARPSRGGVPRAPRLGAAPGRCLLTAAEGTGAGAPGLLDVVQLLRPVQWLKNALVALPMLASHRFEAEALTQTAGAFVAFCLVASGIYAINDVIDRASDAQHPSKRHRPVAAGRLSVGHALATGGLALGAGIALTLAQGWPLFGAVLVYVALVSLYFGWGKRRPILDISILTLLYVLRVVAGGLATGIPASAWLLAFAMFFFFSLATVKRQSEIVLRRDEGRDGTPGRGYRTSDLPLIGAMAIAAGYVSVLVLALYLQSDEVVLLYANPAPLWGVCMIVLFWISRLALLSHRGEVHADPVVHAVSDPVTLACLAAIPVLAALAI